MRQNAIDLVEFLPFTFKVIAKCKCTHCAKSIEFEAAQLERITETSYRVLGQNIDCPHCGQLTQLYLSRHEIVSPKNKANPNTNLKKLNFTFILVVISIALPIIAYSAGVNGYLGNSYKLIEVIIGICCIPFYFMPTIIGWKKKNRKAIFVLNFCLGWTFLGWVGALVWAATVDSSAAKN